MIIPNDTDSSDYLAALARLHQRAYVTPNISRETLIADAVIHSELLHASGHTSSISQRDAELALDFLVLSEEKQKMIALWSNGPRFPFIPHGDNWVLDISAIPHLLINLFFGVPEIENERGRLFEEDFRKLLANEGFHLLPNRKLRLDSGAERETDVAVRIDGVLILIDCRSIERPLDFEIGRPKTFAERQRRLEKKMEKIVSIKEFVKNNLAGANYDFGWAKKIISLGVSPFVEWIWTRNASCWLGNGTFPIIMAPRELVAFLDTVRTPSFTANSWNEKQKARKKRRKENSTRRAGRL